MGTYTIGSGGDYATFTAAEADLTLPEGGGTIYQVTGSVTEAFTFANSDYSNGLTIRAASGEEADGAGSGARVGVHRPEVQGAVYEKLKIDQWDLVTGAFTWTTEITADDCHFGDNLTGTTSCILTGSNYINVKFTLTNCLLVDNDVVGSTSNSGTSQDTILVQCTWVGADGGFRRVLATDCLSLLSSWKCFDSMWSTSDYLASSDTNATVEANTTGYNSRTTADLVNYAGGDYNLDSGSTLYTAGSGGGPIGAILSSGGSILPQIMHHRQQQE